jgi:NAD(P)-dependent dehydrogenase (short-subunit alcohol dehydrogenase family)
VLGPDVDVVSAAAAGYLDTEDLFAELAQVHGRLDVLFINAGVDGIGAEEEDCEEPFDQDVNVGFKGAFFILKRAIPLLARGSSVILNLSSAHNAMAEASGGMASKAALLSLTRVAAAELADRGIRVHAVSPGPVDTIWYVPDKMRLSEDSLEDLFGVIRERTLMKQFGTPEGIANTALCLASTDSSYLLGAEIVANGGNSIAV